MSKNNLAHALLSSLSAINAPKKITIDEFNGDVYIKQLSVKEQEAIATHVKACDTDHMALLFVYGVCDETGARLFDLDDIDKINQLNFKAVYAVIKQINALNGLDETIEAHEKNS